VFRKKTFQEGKIQVQAGKEGEGRDESDKGGNKTAGRFRGSGRKLGQNIRKGGSSTRSNWGVHIVLEGRDAKKV